MKTRNILPAMAVAILIICLSLGVTSAATTSSSSSISSVTNNTVTSHAVVGNVTKPPAKIWTKYLHKSGSISTTPIWSTDIGFVEKWGVFGNASSKNKVGIILGVHPQEGNIHTAMWSAIKTLSPSLKKSQIYVYYVRLGYSQNAVSRDRSRLLGQIIANKIVVPNVDKSFKLIIDVHGNAGNYINNGVMMKNFIFAPSQGTLSKSYAYKIINKSSSVKAWMQLNKNGSLYYPPSQTSPKYVTLPIAAKGVPALVLELYKAGSVTQTDLFNKCKQLLYVINAITYV
jgi:hypothetical protein